MTKIKFIAVLAALVLGTGAVKGSEPTEITEVETAMKTKASPKPKKGRTISLWGHVRNSLTLQGVLDTKITLMTADSVVIDTLRTWRNNGDRMKVDATYKFTIPAEPAQYIILAQHPEYEDCYVDHEVKYIGRNTYFDAEWHNMHLKEEQTNFEHFLDEVVVKATQVKIVYRGDTVAFNADAFNMPEGSMLDALIKQLPGVELKDDGQIFVNGRKIDNLTLNGKDFFKGDNRVMLDNLPNYMVQNVEVYEKSTDKSEWLGIDVEQKEFVMDVKLKREYSTGYIANASLGAGTEERYKGRLFGLRFTTNTRLALYAKLNNVNEARSPGNEGEWDPTKLNDGEIDLKVIGMSLHAEHSDKVWQEQAKMEIGLVDGTMQSHSAQESFLNTGNIFSRTEKLDRRQSFQIGAGNTFTWKKPFWLRATTTFHYTNSDGWLEQRHAQFSDNPGSYGSTPQILDSVYSAIQSASLTDMLVTRSRKNLWEGGEYYQTGLDVNFGKKLPWGDDIDLYANTRYNWNNFKNRNILDNETMATSRDFRNEYSEGGKRDLAIDAEAKYSIHALNRWNYQGYVKLHRAYNYDNTGIFRLDRLDGWGAESERDIYELPSTRDSILLTMDMNNTKETTFNRTKYVPGTRIFYNKEGDGESTWFCVDMPFHIENRSYRHKSPLTDTLVRRHNIIPTPFVEFTRRSHNFDRRYYAKYGMSYNLPGLGHFVDVRNDLDPLNIYIGNNGLKPAISHEFVLDYSIRNRDHNQNLAVGTTSWIHQNSIANGYTYNTETGVRTYRPENVNGNWSTSGYFNFSRDLDEQRHWHWQTRTNFSYHRNVDIASTEGATGNERLSKVNNWWMKEYTRLAFQWEDFKLGANGTVQYRIVDSHRQNFQTIHTWDFNYGLTCEYRLPFGMQLATDLKMFSRRGYGDSSMNTDDLVWNASLTQPLFKSRVLLQLEGYDLLHQLSNVYSSYNAQGRTETWHNTVPSYVMLHLTYKLNVMPKKR